MTAPMYELKVTGWGGVAPPESGVRQLEYCPACKYRNYSTFSTLEKVIDWKTWDGSDIFVAWPAPRFIFVTRRVADMLKREGVSGWEAKDPAELSPSGGNTLTPGRLAYWFSEERLAQLVREGRLPPDLID